MSTKNQTERAPAVRPNKDGRFLERKRSYGSRILIATGLTIAPALAVELISQNQEPSVAHASGLTPCDPATQILIDYDDISGDGEYTPYVDWAYCGPLPTTTTVYIPPSTTHKVTTTTIKKPPSSTTSVAPATSSTSTTTTEVPVVASSEAVESTGGSTASSTVDSQGVETTTTSIIGASGPGSENEQNGEGMSLVVPIFLLAGAALVIEQAFRKKSLSRSFIAGAKRRHKEQEDKKQKQLGFS